MASDLRVDLDPLLAAFGVPATVTRPWPDDTPIETAVIWLTPDGGSQQVRTEAFPLGSDLQRREQELMLAVPKAAVATVPVGTVIEAPIVVGGAARRWRVVDLAYDAADESRAWVVPETEP